MVGDDARSDNGIHARVDDRLDVFHRDQTVKDTQPRSVSQYRETEINGRAALVLGLVYGEGRQGKRLDGRPPERQNSALEREAEEKERPEDREG